MKRLLALSFCMILVVLLLTGCQSKEEEPQDLVMNITQAILPAATPEATSSNSYDDSGSSSVSVFDQNPYLQDYEYTDEQALSEEDEYYGDNDGDIYQYDYSIEATVYPYAGSTPIPLNPIDMPTPTPRPELVFDYMQYTASSLGLTFEAPVNWITDESNYDLFLLTEPESQKKDNFCCEIQISRESVTESYSQKMLNTYVKQRMSTILESRLKSYSPSNTATRNMLKNKGVYMNYTGTLTDGTEVGGRILYVCINKTLYGLEIMYPLGYKEDYINVFGQIRSTMATY